MCWRIRSQSGYPALHLWWRVPDKFPIVPRVQEWGVHLVQLQMPEGYEHRQRDWDTEQCELKRDISIAAREAMHDPRFSRISLYAAKFKLISNWVARLNAEVIWKDESFKPFRFK